ncbi:MAG: PAS domain S-box protein [Halorhodospira sp.]
MEAYSLQEQFARLPMGMCRTEPGAAGAFLDANPAFVRMLGLSSAAELLGHEPAAFYRYPEQRAALSQALLEHGQVQQELELVTLDARPIWVSLHLQCREITGHGPVFEGTAEDITARKQGEATQQRLAEQEAFFRDLVDHHPGFIGWCLPDTTIQFANTTLTQFWGEPLAGVRWLDLVSADRRADLRDYLQRFTPEAPLGTYEHQLRRSDGALRTIQWTVRAFFDGAGGLTHYQGVGLDITEQREAEEALRESERRFRQMAEGIEEIFCLRRGDELLYVSPACERLLGLPPEAVYPSFSNILAMIPPEDRERTRAALYEAEALGEPSDEIHRIVRPDGEVRWLHTHGYTLQDEHDGSLLRAGTARDVTAYKALQHQLEAANRAKSDALNAVSHDLRTPLNALMGLTDLLAESPLDAEQRHHLSLCRSAGQRLLGLIDTLLELSRLQRGDVVADQQPMELRAFLDEQIGLLLPQARVQGLVLDWYVDSALPTYAETDPNRLAQVLFNLVGNAIEYTEAGTVEVAVRRDGPERARIAVRDTGPGIPPSTQQRIFEPFERGEAGTRQHHSGLGLALARDLVRLLGGEISVDSEPGKGTTFTFTLALPATAPPAPEDQRHEVAEPEPPAAPGEGLHVLAAEDDTTNALLLQSLFDRAACIAEVVTDGEELITAWERMRPDLVVLDLDMPRVDGYQALGALRAREAFYQCGHTPVVALTAHAHEDTRAACYAVGYDTYLSKPVGWQDIHRLVAWARRQAQAR